MTDNNRYLVSRNKREGWYFGYSLSHFDCDKPISRHFRSGKFGCLKARMKYRKERMKS